MTSYFPTDPHNPSDALGQPIHPNDYVIYFTGDSSSVSGTIARIVRINDKPQGSYSYGGRSKPTYTLTLEPIFDGQTYSFGWPMKEAVDPNFTKISFDYNQRDAQGNAAKVASFPGVKQVFDTDGKRKTVNLQRVQNVVKVDSVLAVQLESANIHKFNTRTEGTR